MAQRRATQRRVRTAGGGYDIAVEAPPGNHEEHAAHDARAAKNDEDAGDAPTRRAETTARRTIARTLAEDETSDKT